MTKVVDEKITIQPQSTTPAAPAINVNQVIQDVDSLVNQLGTFLKDVKETSTVVGAFVDSCIDEFKKDFETLKADAGIVGGLKKLFSSQTKQAKQEHLVKLLGDIQAKKKETGSK